MIYIFDFDGTLVDSMGSWAGVHTAMLKKYNIPCPSDFVKTITPLGNLRASKHTLSLGVPLTLDEYLESINKTLAVAYGENIPAKKNVPQRLMHLKACGHSLHVLTASPHKFLDICLKRTGIYDLFDNVWSIDDFGMTKSETRIYEEAAARIGVTTADCIFVDDNFTAVETAKKAGMKTVAVYDDTSAEYADDMKTIADQYVCDFGDIKDDFQ